MNAVQLRLDSDKNRPQQELQLRKQELEYVAQEQQLQREHELQLAQLKIQCPPPPVHLSKHLPLLPQFLDEDPDTFFRQFESRAVNLNIDRNQRALLL